MAEPGRAPAAREAWERSLRAALEAKATELAVVAADSTDAVARALLTALEAAKAAGNWAEVAELARALDGHRRGRAGVVRLDSARAKRGGKR